MAKLYFKFGAMNSSKTANALMTKFNYEEKGYTTILLKPMIDTRDTQYIIKSRIGLEAKAVPFAQNDDMVALWQGIEPSPDVIIVDEAQFCKREQIEQLKQVAEEYNVPVLCYGLKTDFRSELFEGSKRLLEIADSLSEIKSVCTCGKKAIINARMNEQGDIITHGEQIEIGGNDKYIGMCYHCWINKITP